MTITREGLRRLAARLDKKWTLNAPADDESIVPFKDPRDARLEHLLHELGHAVLLGVEPGPMLSLRIGAETGRLKNWPFPGARALMEENELETFAVVMRVLPRLGIRCDRWTMCDAAQIQVELRPEEIEAFWSAFEADEDWRCEAAAQEVLAIVLGQLESLAP